MNLARTALPALAFLLAATTVQAQPPGYIRHNNSSNLEYKLTLPYIANNYEEPPICPGHTKFGIHLLIEQDPVIDIRSQLGNAYELVGKCGLVKALVPDIGVPGKSPDYPKWAMFAREAKAKNLFPVLRLQGEFSGQRWEKPDEKDDYSHVAAKYAEAVAKISSASRTTIPYAQVWNEPNLRDEWGGNPNPAEYARFLLRTAAAIRAASPRTKIMNAPLAITQGTEDGRNIETLEFIRQMFAAEPGLTNYVDIWAVNEYENSRQCMETNSCLESYKQQLAAISTFYHASGKETPTAMLAETSFVIISDAADVHSTATFTPEEFAGIYRKWLDEKAIIGIAPFAYAENRHGHWKKFAWADRKNRFKPTKHLDRILELRIQWQNER